MLYDQRWELDDVSKILLAAADYLEEHGWCQHRMAIGASACAVGALLRVGDSSEAISIAIRRLRSHTGRDTANWNDDRSRTKAQVIAAMREAARLR